MGSKMKYREKNKDQLINELKILHQELDTLKEAKECLDNIFDNSPDAIGIVDRHGRFLKWNKMAEEHYGYSPEDILKLKTFDLYDDKEELDKMLNKLRNNGIVKRYEINLKKKDGTLVPSSISISLLKDGNNNTKGSVGVARDVSDRKAAEEELKKYREHLEEMVEQRTAALRAANEQLKREISDRRRAEEALRKSEAKYRELVENANSIILRMDPTGRVTFFNEFAQTFFDFPAEEIMGQNVVGTIVPEVESSGRDLAAMIADIGRHPERYVTNENENMKRNGERVWVAWTNKGVVDERGNIVEILCVGNDITERRQLAHQLIQAQKMEAVGRLAGGLAHDFNNLLSAILGYAGIMRLDLPPDNPFHHQVQEIIMAAHRGASLTHQLLAFSRKQIMQPQVVDLNDVVTGLEKMLRPLIGEDIALVTTLDPGLGAVKVDPGQMEQVIMNLVVNARDAMPNGGRLSLETANIYLDESYAQPDREFIPGKYIRLAVSDNGVGMDAETQAQIFEPFFTTKDDKGTGLGLAMVQGIVKRSHGHIEVYSQLGQGTTFKIYLPRCLEAVEAPRVREAPRQELRGRETILVVEDDRAVRDVVARALRRYGYCVLEARHGSAGLQICTQQKGPIHLMLTDVVMPEMSGPKLREHLAALHPDIKMLYMSGYTENAIAHLGVLDRKAAFLQKPFSVTALLEKVREVLDTQADKS